MNTISIYITFRKVARGLYIILANKYNKIKVKC